MSKFLHIALLSIMFLLFTTLFTGCDLFGGMKAKSVGNYEAGIKYYESENPENRVLAITHYFAKSDDPRSVEHIIKALEDKDNKVRATAMDALVEKKGVDSVEHIMFMLSDTDAGNVRQAKGYLKSFGSDAVPKLQEELLKPGYNQKAKIISTMGIITDDHFIDTLGRIVLDEKDFRLRVLAIEALTNYEQPGAQAYVARGLIDRIAQVKIAALINLKRDGSDEFVKLVLPLTRDPNQKVAIKAVEALKENNNPKAVELLIKLLHDSESKNFLIESITTALSELGTASNSRYYVEALDDPKQYVRLAILKAAVDSKNSKWAEEVINHGADNDMPEIKNMALFALKKAKSSVRVPRLLEALNDNNRTVRKNAIMALAELPEARTYEKEFTSALNDSDMSVRIETVKALPKINAPWAFNLLVSVITEYQDDQNMAVAAAYSLSKYKKNKRATEVLGQALNSSNSTLSNAAANALVAIGDNEAVRELLMGIKSDYPHVKMLSLKSLEKLQVFPSMQEMQVLVNDSNKEVRALAVRSLKLMARQEELKKRKQDILKNTLLEEMKKNQKNQLTTTK